MATPGYSPSKDQLLKRLNRAEGQVRGVSRMIANDAYCIEVLTQISAAQSALNKVAIELAQEHARSCLMDGTDYAPKAEARAKELADAFERLI